MMKMRNHILSLLLSLICVFTLLPARAFAADTIDPGRDVSLTIVYAHDGAPVSGVQFDLYYVASVDERGTFTLAGDFTAYPVQVNGLNAETQRALAETLAAYADRDQLRPLDSGETDAKGRLTFPNQRASLKTGMYLAVGRTLTTDGYTYTTEPFLISLPNLDEASGTWSYAVAVEPKHTREENPPTPPEDSTVERRVLKIWKDDLEALRPGEVTVQLLKDGAIYDTVTLNAANNWRYTWKKLPEYNKDGSKIVWSVVEKELKNYTVLITRDGITFTVTNTYSPVEPTDDTVTRTVLKIWNDKGYESKRPRSVQVTLLKNGAVYDTQTLDDTNGWQYVWEKLPRYDESGIEISWTVREASVSGYKSSVRQKDCTFVLTNTPDEPKLPQTGVLWWPVPVLAVIGLVFLILGVLSRKRRS